MPTPMPTLAPTTPQPSTAAPTCVGQSLDVCIIVDESGSICSLNSPRTCTGGSCAAVDPITGSTFCDGPFTGDGCDFENGCPRFNDIAGDDTPNVKNFAKRFIDEFEDQLANKGATSQYSVVEFATLADVTIGLTTPAAAKAAVNAIVYSGGFTNLQQGILKCNATLKESKADVKSIIGITDGTPTARDDGSSSNRCLPGTAPNTACKAAAEAAADDAKAAGIDIATVYVLGGPSDGSI